MDLRLAVQREVVALLRDQNIRENVLDLRHRSLNAARHRRDKTGGLRRTVTIWLERNEDLLREGRAILDDLATYCAHLDRIEDGRERLLDEVSGMERFSSAYRAQSRSRDRGPTRSM